MQGKIATVLGFIEPEKFGFTIAHELGHIFLGHNSGSQPSKINFYSQIFIHLKFTLIINLELYEFS